MECTQAIDAYLKYREVEEEVLSLNLHLSERTSYGETPTSLNLSLEIQLPD
jgi:hypothetical protein